MSGPSTSLRSIHVNIWNTIIWTWSQSKNSLCAVIRGHNCNGVGIWLQKFTMFGRMFLHHRNIPCYCPFSNGLQHSQKDMNRLIGLRVNPPPFLTAGGQLNNNKYTKIDFFILFRRKRSIMIVTYCFEWNITWYVFDIGWSRNCTYEIWRSLVFTITTVTLKNCMETLNGCISTNG